MFSLNWFRGGVGFRCTGAHVKALPSSDYATGIHTGGGGGAAKDDKLIGDDLIGGCVVKVPN